MHMTNRPTIWHGGVREREHKYSSLCACEGRMHAYAPPDINTE